MKNTFGSAVTLTVFGESHGPYIGAVLDGIAPGIKVEDADIRAALDMRAPAGKISTKRHEADNYITASGVFDGKTTGTPLCIIIPNENVKSGDYEYGKARPGHADYTAYLKYHGFEDYRGGGHFSARVTAAAVAVCAPLRRALEDKGISIGSHIKYLHGIKDRDFEDYEADIKKLNSKKYPVLSDDAADEMIKLTEKVAESGDSIGGILQTAIIGMPGGVGEPFFDSMESELAHILFSVPAVKGVSFGAGSGFADMYGSEANDGMRIEDGKVVFMKNDNGGINGGITNGEPIIINTVIKPTPSIYSAQRSVNFKTGENIDLQITGRHDPAVIHRARAVVDSFSALAIADMLTVRYGCGFFGGEK